MNSFDAIIIIIIGYCVIRGVFRGIIKEASSIIGVLAGLYAAYTYYPTLTSDLEGFKNLFHSTGIMNIFSFLIIFFVIFMVVSALGILIKILLKIIFLSWVDRVFGGCFGFIKGILITSTILLVLTTFLDSGSPVISESALCPFVSSISEAMSHFASNSMRHEFSSKMNVAKKSWGKEGDMTSETVTPKASDTTRAMDINKGTAKNSDKTGAKGTAKPMTKGSIKANHKGNDKTRTPKHPESSGTHRAEQ